MEKIFHDMSVSIKKKPNTEKKTVREVTHLIDEGKTVLTPNVEIRRPALIFYDDDGNRVADPSVSNSPEYLPESTDCQAIMVQRNSARPALIFYDDKGNQIADPSGSDVSHYFSAEILESNELIVGNEDEVISGDVVEATKDGQVGGVYVQNMVNFIARPSDTALTGASDSKNAEAEPVPAESETLKEQRSPIANYQVVPEMIEHAVDWRGQCDTEKSLIHAKIYIRTSKGTYTKTLIVPADKVGSLTQIIGKKYPTSILYDKSGGSQIENEFRENMSGVNEVICFLDHGWQLIGDRFVYVHSDAEVPGRVMTRMKLPTDPMIHKENCYGIWQRSMTLSCQSGVMAAMGVFSFLGVAWRLFDEAGFPPRFVLFMTGKTNSYKTSLAKVLYTQVEEDRYRQCPRRIDSDTCVSLERGLVLSGRDNVTLIDDFSPAATPQKKAKLTNDLEAIVRAVGDGSSKSRSNASLEDCRGEGIRGAVVVTGELKGEGLSSNLRCLYCVIDGESVNRDVLTWFQRHKGAYETLIQNFIFYLSDSWADVVAYIGRSFEIYRSKARNSLNTGRLADALVTLWIMADIVCDFFARYCGVQECSDVFDKVKNDIIPVVMESERISFEEDPAVTFMRALSTMLENQQLRVKTGRFTKAELPAYDGFAEAEYLYFLPTQTYQKIGEWIRRGGGHLTLSEKEVSSALVREGYTVPSSNGCGKRTLYARLAVQGGGRQGEFLETEKAGHRTFFNKRTRLFLNRRIL